MSCRRLNPPHRTAIGPGLQTLLAHALGVKTAWLLRPVLDRAVQWYRELDTRESCLRQDFKWEATVDCAFWTDLAQKADAYHASLADIQAYNSDPPSLGGMGIDERVRDAEAVARDARRESQQAESHRRRRRGRRHSSRHYLALAVVRILRAFNLPVVVSRDRGEFLKLLMIAYEAAGIPIPLDPMRDMAEAVRLAARQLDPHDDLYDFIVERRDSLRPRPAPPSPHRPRRSRVGRGKARCANRPMNRHE